uniref:Reverse transcriptase domain-containing protein n=1 Tax=Amphimedon queenslandica TaxID=400682 RepID=A0A1X7TJ92_AMPQE
MKGSPDVNLSQEGVTQGDPLSMFNYAVATVLIRKLNQISDVTQLWYADDSSAIGGLSQLRIWFDLQIEIGPHYGYFPEPRNSSLIIKCSVSVEDTRGFSDVGVNVVTSCRFLGGSDVGRDEFVSSKSEEWEHHVNLLSDIAKDQPQAVYVALTKSLQNEWAFLQRVISHYCHHFQQVENALSSKFIPTLIGHNIAPIDRDLFSLPIRNGGLDAPSYINKTPDTVLKNAEKEKKMKYGCTCEDRHASVTPLCISIDGLMGKEMESFDQHLAESLATKWDRQLSTTLHWDQELPTAEIKRTMLVVAVKKASTKRVSYSKVAEQFVKIANILKQ